MTGETEILFGTLSSVSVDLALTLCWLDTVSKEPPRVVIRRSPLSVLT